MKLRSAICGAIFLLMLAAPGYAEKIRVNQMVSIRFDAAWSSATAHSGDSWSGTLTQDIVVDGKTLAHAGDKVLGVMLEVRAGAGADARGSLKMGLKSINGVEAGAGTVTRSVVGKIAAENAKANATIAAGDVLSFYVSSLG